MLASKRTIRRRVKRLKTEESRLSSDDKLVKHFKPKASIASQSRKHNISRKALAPDFLEKSASTMTLGRSSVKPKTPRLNEGATVNTLKSNLLKLQRQLRRKPETSRPLKKKSKSFKQGAQPLSTRDAIILELLEKTPSQLVSAVAAFVNAVTACEQSFQQWLDSVPPNKLVFLSPFFTQLGQEVPAVLPSALPREVLATICYKYSASQTTANDNTPQQALQQLSLKLQLLGITKDRLSLVLFGPGYTPDQLVSRAQLEEILQKQPFNCSASSTLNSLLQFCCPRPVQTAELILSRVVEATEPWVDFGPHDEEEADQQLALIVNRHGTAILQACAVYAEDLTESVTLDQFLKVLAGLGIRLSEALVQFIKLRCFSLCYELNVVPYVQFVSAYLEEESEDDRITLARQYLQIIARRLANYRLSAEQVFGTGEFIYPEEFLSGLKRVGLDSFSDNELALLLEAVQYTGRCTCRCIKTQELVELLSEFGLATSPAEADESLNSIIVRNDSSLEEGTLASDIW